MLEKIEAIIKMQGPLATVCGVNLDLLRPQLTFDDPQARNTTAFQEGRWDGKRCLLDGNSNFPSGLVPHVCDVLKRHKLSVRILGQPKLDVDLKRMNRKYLRGIELWDHQMESILALALTNPCCAVSIPTRGGKTPTFWRSLPDTSGKKTVGRV